MKFILLSCSPKECAAVLSGRLSSLVRKKFPKCELPFKVFLYCTKDRPYLAWEEGDYDYDDCSRYFAQYSCFNTKVDLIDRGEEFSKDYPPVNGKIVGEFIVSKIDKLEIYDDGCVFIRNQEQCTQEEILDGSCLTIDQLYDYIGYGDDNSEGEETAVGYAWCIGQVEVYYKPRELSEFHKVGYNEMLEVVENAKPILSIPDCSWAYAIYKAPQSWCYIEEDTK